VEKFQLHPITTPEADMKASSVQDRLSILESNEVKIIKPSTKKTITRTSDGRNANKIAYWQDIYFGKKYRTEEEIETSAPENKRVEIRERGITERDFARKIN
uniref:hypothetical protein n=1 Tax=uncultured Campylobacter sp. TaxID=218934 RepID=UPI00261393CC